MRSVVEAMECRRLLSAGDPDPTFGGGDGISEAAFPGSGAAAVDTRGGFTVVAGGMSVARFNNSGQLDPGFDGDGRLTRPGFLARDVFIQPDGRILVAGDTGGRGAVLRLNANGSTDTAFGGGDGLVTLGSLTSANSVRLGPGNKVVLGGGSIPVGAGSAPFFAAARLNPNGTPDATFGGGDGEVVTTFRASGIVLPDIKVAAQSDGKVVLAGAAAPFPEGSGSDVGVVRLTNSGAFDNSFSGDGRFRIDFATDDEAGGVDIAPDGRIVVSMTLSDLAWAPIRFNHNGTVDRIFEPVALGASGSRLGDVRVSFDGSNRVLGFGTFSLNFDENDSAALRWDSDGTVDHTFGNGRGHVAGNGLSHGDLQADLKIIAAGSGSEVRRLIYADDRPAKAVARDNTLFVEGSVGNDVIDVARTADGTRIEVRNNGAFQSFPSAGIGLIVVEAGNGADRVTVRNWSGDTVLDGGDGNDTLSGGSGQDLMIGDRGNDTLNGLAGSDRLFGGYAPRLRGEFLDEFILLLRRLQPADGNDVLRGGDGNDYLEGGRGGDDMSGGAGFDTIDYSYRTGNLTVGLGSFADDGEAGERDNARSDVEELLGGTGNDTFTGSSAANRFDGGGGNDRLFGRGGNDTLLGGFDGGDDLLRGEDGNDTLDGGEGADDMSGGSGTDTLDYSGSESGGVSVGLGSVADDGRPGEKDNARSDIENVTGTRFNDLITGTSAANRLDGGGGDDRLFGRGGNDTIIGGAGRDALHGDDGNDTLFARDGEADFLSGGFGTDTAEKDDQDTTNGVERFL